MGLRRTLNMIRNIENWNNYLVYKWEGKKNEKFIFKLRNKFPVSVHRQIMVEFKEIVFDEIYYRYLPKKIYSLNNPTVIDIGANAGFFSIFSLFKLNNPKIICFEPIKRNFLILENNLSAMMNNDLFMVNKAVNDKKGELILKFDKTKNITTSASLFDNPYGSDEETVIATTLVEIFSDNKLSKIDVLKLDCEGAEYNIIYNTPSSFFEKVNCITMETHEGKDKKENTLALAGYIGELGFTVKTKDDFIWSFKDPEQWI